MNRDADRVEQVLAEGADGDAGRGLAGRGALEDVADVGQLVLHDAGQVGVAGARHVDDACASRVDLGELFIRDRPGTLRGAPVLVIAVLDDQAQRPPERAAMAHTTEDRGLVGLDRLARRAAITGLAPSEIALQAIAVRMQSCGQTREDRDDAGTMRLAGGDEGERHQS